MYYLRLFGGVALSGSGGVLTGRASQRRQLSLLVLLATEDTVPASRDKLAALLWPEASAGRARARLSDAIHVLNKDLGETAVLSSRSHVSLDTGVLWHDVGAFRQALSRGDLPEALRLYAGPFVDAFHGSDSVEFERWIDSHRERLRQEAVSAAWDLCQRYEGRGMPLEASFWATRARVIDPYSEDGLRRQITLLSNLGDRAGIERIYREFVKRLDEDLGLEPSAESAALVEATRKRGDRPASTPDTQPRGTESDRGAIVAVLPLEFLGDAESGIFFADGLTEDLRTRLAHVRGVEVRAPGPTRSAVSAMGYRQLRDALEAAFVLEGTVRRDGSRLRISARLVESDDGNQLWGDSYDADLSVAGIFKVQTEIAQRIADALETTLSASGPGIPETSLEAYDYYLLGRHYAGSFTAQDTRKCKDCFERAIALDPSFGRAHAGLALLYLVMGGAGRAAAIPTHEAVGLATGSARRALELGGADADAYAVLGLTKLFLQGDRTGSRDLFYAAVHADERSARARFGLSYYLSSCGRHEEAIQQVEEAVRLDPQDPVSLMTAGGSYYLAGQYERAIDGCRRALDLEPRQNVAWGYLGLSHAALSAFEEAREALEVGTALSGGRWEPFYGNVLARSGDRSGAEALLARYASDGTSPSFALAVVQVGLGLAEDAIANLHRAVNEATQYRLNMPFLGVEPVWDPLRGDDRFVSLLRELGLDDLGLSSAAEG